MLCCSIASWILVLSASFICKSNKVMLSVISVCLSLCVCVGGGGGGDGRCSAVPSPRGCWFRLHLSSVNQTNKYYKYCIKVLTPTALKYSHLLH